MMIKYDNGGVAMAALVVSMGRVKVNPLVIVLERDDEVRVTKAKR